MDAWVKVVTSPLGLVGFALFLVFSFLGTSKKKPTWFPVGAYGMAVLALVGGILIAYLHETQSKGNTAEQHIGSIRQGQSGIGANTAGVQGNVTTTITGAPVFSYPAAPSTSGDALALEEVKSRIAPGVDQAALLKAVRDRGISFQLTPEITGDLRAMGASDAVISALEQNKR